MRDFLRLFKFLKPHTLLFLIASACMVISTIFNGISLGMIVPLADRILTNRPIVFGVRLPRILESLVISINSIEPLKLLNILAIIITILFFLKCLFLFLQSFLMNKLSLLVIKDVRNILFKKFHSLSFDYFSEAKTGEMVSRITYDVSLIQNSITEGLTDTIYQTLQIILFTIVAFVINWKLACIVLILFPLISYPIIRVGKILKEITTKAQEKVADINTTIIETITGIRIVKAFSMEEKEIERFQKQNQGFYKMNLKVAKRNIALQQVTEYMGGLAGIIVLLLGGRHVIYGRLSIGVFILFLGSLLSLVRPFKRLSQVYSINQQAASAAVRIFNVLDLVPSIVDKIDAIELPPFKKSITFENVHFKYEEEEVLKDINFQVESGKIIALVGPSGVGKTTWVNLIPRFYDPTKGAIKIDGIDIRDARIKSLRNQIGIVTQETILFNDTVKANISYGKPGASMDEIVSVAKKAQAHDFIMKMPKGYDTVIGEMGFKLSGGEKQRMAIARAMLKNPPILILDEATSQLDTESERLVQQAIEVLMKDRTVFVIAHRLSTVRDADLILLLEEGRIAQVGRHEELMKTSNLYKRLYELQFKD